MIVIVGGLIVLLIPSRLMYGLFSFTKNITSHRLGLTDVKIVSCRMVASVTMSFIHISHLACY